LHLAQLMPLPLTVSCFSTIQIGFTFLVPAYPGSRGKRAIKRVCVSVCVYVLYLCNAYFFTFEHLFFIIVTTTTTTLLLRLFNGLFSRTTWVSWYHFIQVSFLFIPSLFLIQMSAPLL